MSTKGVVSPMKGKTRSKEFKDKISKSLIGHTRRKGKHHSEATIQKMSRSQQGKHSGEKCSFWKGGISTINHNVRAMPLYNKWRIHVFGRDNYICRECGIRGVYFEAHHIKSLASILRYNNIRTMEDAKQCTVLWDLDNGITLCKQCHTKTYTYKR